MNKTLFTVLFAVLFLTLLIVHFSGVTETEIKPMAHETLGEPPLDEFPDSEAEETTPDIARATQQDERVQIDSDQTEEQQDKSVVPSSDADTKADGDVVAPLEDETNDIDVDMDFDTVHTADSCTPETHRYIACDHDKHKLQKQICGKNNRWEHAGDCFDPPAALEMISISAGSFWMGSPAQETGRSIDESRHFVELTYSFMIGKYEETQGVFAAVMGYNPASFPGCGEECPAENISWHEAAAYANERSRIAGLPTCFICQGKPPAITCTWDARFKTPHDCPGYRLPTEAEWEYATRAGTTTALYNRRDMNDAAVDAALAPLAWYAGNAVATYEGAEPCEDRFEGAKTCGINKPGKKAPNDWELYDTLGNVEEWTLDNYRKEYPIGTEDAPAVDPFVAPGSDIAVRGGHWKSPAGRCRCAARSHHPPGFRSKTTGFRLVKSE